MWRLVARSGVTVRVGSVGAALIAVEAPDRSGRTANIALGLESAAAYRSNPHYLGAIVGRYANRIAGAAFTLAGHTHHLDANDGPHCLHGGRDGWHLRDWHGTTGQVEGAPAIRLRLVSPDGDGGFPGKVTCSVTYALTDDGRLIIDLAANSDAPTPFSPTQHGYWNLSGDPHSTIADHALMVAADQWLPVDGALIPCGDPAPVAGTLYDFTTVRRLGAAMAGGGLDHCLLLRGSALREVARLTHPGTGRMLTISTDRPAMQLYTGQHLGPPYHHFAGVALETQLPPDAPNQPRLGDAILRPGVPWHSRTIYAFGLC